MISGAREPHPGDEVPITRTGAEMFSRLRKFTGPNDNWACQCELSDLYLITGVAPTGWGVNPELTSAVVFSTGQINLKEENKLPQFDVAANHEEIGRRVQLFFEAWEKFDTYRDEHY